MTARYLMNADMLIHCNTSPRTASNGTELTLTKNVQACPWFNKGGVIKAGKYIVVSRKHFNGGVLVVEQKFKIAMI